MPYTTFLSTRHGFHFSNQFVNHILTIPGHAPIATAGRCGGMAYAALDYYFAGIAVPTHLAEDFPAGPVPADGSRLADYIYRRLFDTFVDGGIRFVTWTVNPDQDRRFQKGVTRLTKEEELPRLRQKIDAGQPVALGLIKATCLADIGLNHQVVAYGYEYDESSQRLKIAIYDNNYPDHNDVSLITDPFNPHFHEEIRGEVVTTWRGFFVQSYHPQTPQYIDLALIDGLSISSAAPFLRQPFRCQYTVKNLGDYPAHLRCLQLSLRDPDGQDLDHYLGSDDNDLPLQPGEERTIARSSDFPAEKAGTYQLSAKYYSVQEEWMDLPPGNPAVINRFDVHAQAEPPYSW